MHTLLHLYGLIWRLLVGDDLVTVVELKIVRLRVDVRALHDLDRCELFLRGRLGLTINGIMDEVAVSFVVFVFHVVVHEPAID